MAEIKAVVFDLDGTLLHHNGHISHLNRQVIAELKKTGILLIVATGRNITLAKNVDLPQEIDYVICANGSVIYRRSDWQILMSKFMEPEIALAIYRRFRDCHYHLHAYYGEGQFVFEYMNPELGKRYATSLLNIEKSKINYDDLDPQRFVKFVTYGEREDLQPIVAPLAEQFGVRLYANFSLHGVMELMSNSVSKAQALEVVLGWQQLTAADVLAFGDGFNDVTMLEKAKYAVVMENSHPEIRARAHMREFYLAGNNNDDGVGQFLRSWFKLA